MLKKFKKNDYTDPKVYRFIALLNTVKKALKAVIEKKLNNIAKANRLLPDS